MSSDLVEHLGLLLRVGVKDYMDRGLLGQVKCPDDRARLYRLVRELEGRHGE